MQTQSTKITRLNSSRRSVDFGMGYNHSCTRGNLQWIDRYYSLQKCENPGPTTAPPFAAKVPQGEWYLFAQTYPISTNIGCISIHLLICMGPRSILDWFWHTLRFFGSSRGLLSHFSSIFSLVMGYARNFGWYYMAQLSIQSPAT